MWRLQIGWRTGGVFERALALSHPPPWFPPIPSTKLNMTKSEYMKAYRVRNKGRIKSQQAKYWKEYYQRNREGLDKAARVRIAKLRGNRPRTVHVKGTSRAKELIREAKSGPCKDCGLLWPQYVMEFDHCRGRKLFTVGSGRHSNTARLISEINKCDVVCANCHKIRTHERRVKR